jgi:hypothetical protein
MKESLVSGRGKLKYSNFFHVVGSPYPDAATMELSASAGYIYNGSSRCPL